MTVTTNPDGICVELHGREQFWALRAKVSVPRGTITSVRFEPMFQTWRKWQVRMPGTHAPRRLLAGSYWTEEGWDFMYVRRPIGFFKPKLTNVLVIESDQDRYKRVIVSLDPVQAGRIIKWWKNNVQSKPKSRKPRSSR